MLVFVAAWIFVTIHCATGQAPVPVIESVEPTEQGTLIRWRLDPPVTVKNIRIVYEGSDGTAESLTVDGNKVEALLQLVRPCTNYSVVVTATDVEDNSVDSEPSHFTGFQLPTPSPPTNLRVIEEATGRFLNWDPPVNTSYIRNYNIIGQSGDQEPIRMKATYDQTAQNLSSFPIDHSFDVWMTAENLCNVSVESAPIHVAKIEAPATPLIQKVEPKQREIRIQFTKGTEGSEVFGFRISYKTKNGEEVVIDQNSDTQEVSLTTGIENCYKYVIEVYALNAAGLSVPAIVTAFAKSEELPPKPQPPNLSEDGTSVHVSWTVANVDQTMAHEVMYLADGVTPQSVIVNASHTGTRLDDLHRCSSYTVRIRTQWRCGWSAYSDPVTVQIQPVEVPQKPSNLRTQRISSSCVLLWENAEQEELRTQHELAISDEDEPARYYWIGPFEEQYNLGNMKQNKDYKIMLWARNDCGWSDVAEATVRHDSSRCAIVP